MTTHLKTMAIVQLALIGVALCAAQTQPVPDAQTATLLESRDWQQRRKGFYTLLESAGTGEDIYRDPRSAAIALKKSGRHLPLLKLLASENVFRVEIRRLYDRTGQQAPDGYHDYFPNVVSAVCAIREPASIPLLLPSIASGAMVSQALVGMGDAAVPTLLDLLGNKNHDETIWQGPYKEFIRDGVFAVLDAMLDQPASVVSEVTRSKIKALFMGFPSEADWFVKEHAMGGLAKLGGDDAREAIQSYLDKTAFDETSKIDQSLKQAAHASLEKLKAKAVR